MQSACVVNNIEKGPEYLRLEPRLTNFSRLELRVHVQRCSAVEMVNARHAALTEGHFSLEANVNKGVGASNNTMLAALSVVEANDLTSYR